MRYATGWKDGCDPGLAADITGADVLTDFLEKCFANLGRVIVSDKWDATDTARGPEHLRDLKVLGTLMTQSEDGEVLDDNTVYVIDDGSPLDEEDILLERILDLDSAGTGEACSPSMVLSGTKAVVIEYFHQNAAYETLGRLGER